MHMHIWHGRLHAWLREDPDWYMKNQIAAGPGLLAKKRVSDDVSMCASGSQMPSCCILPAVAVEV